MARITSVLITLCLFSIFAVLSQAQLSNSTLTGPFGVRLSTYGQVSNSMLVTWSYNFESARQQQEYEPAVRYGLLNQTTLPWSAKKCTGRSYVDLSVHYTCLMYNLMPNSRYFYQIQPGSFTTNASVTFAFRTPVEQMKTQRSIILGDMGWLNSQGTIDALKEWTNPVAPSGQYPLISHMFHAGDIAYSDMMHVGEANPDFERINDVWFDMAQPLTSAIAYNVAIGNHDVSGSLATDDDILPEWQRNCTSYINRWAMTSATSKGKEDLWYSYIVGNTRFIVINTETDYPSPAFTPDAGQTRAGGFGDQTTWLREQLRVANDPAERLFTPWVVVIGHRPVYSTLIKDFPDKQQDRIREWLEPLFVEFRVDMYISGHLHLYERTLPTKNGKPTQQDYHQPDATVYVINGAAGNVEAHPVPGIDVMVDLPDYTPYRNGEQYGFGLLETFDSAPPSYSTEHVARHHSVGDFLGKSRGLNNTNISPSQDFIDAYYDKLTTQQQRLKTQHKLHALKTGDQVKKTSCPDNAQMRSMCYSFFPAFANQQVIQEQKYLDRICITRC